MNADVSLANNKENPIHLYIQTLHDEWTVCKIQLPKSQGCDWIEFPPLSPPSTPQDMHKMLAF